MRLVFYLIVFSGLSGGGRVDEVCALDGWLWYRSRLLAGQSGGAVTGQAVLQWQSSCQSAAVSPGLCGGHVVLCLVYAAKSV